MKESFKTIDFLILPAEHGLLLFLGLEAHQVHLSHLLLEIFMLCLVLHLEWLSMSLAYSKIFSFDDWSFFCEFRIEGGMHSVGSIPIGSNLNGIVFLLLVIESIVGYYPFDPVLGAGSLC